MPHPTPLALIGNLALPELILVGVVALMIWGKDLPQVAMRGAAHLVKLRRQVAKMWREAGLEEELRRVKRDIERETRLDDPPRVQPPPAWRPNVRSELPEELVGKSTDSPDSPERPEPLDPLAPGRSSAPDEPPPAPPAESPEEPDEPAGERERRASAAAPPEPAPLVGTEAADRPDPPGSSAAPAPEAPAARDDEVVDDEDDERGAKESA